MSIYRMKDLLIPALLAATGCGVVTTAQVETAKAAIKEKIDDAVGRLEVRRREILAGLEKSESALAALREARITSEARARLIDNRLKPIQQRVDSAEAALGKIGEALGADQALVVSGVSMDQQSLQKCGTEILEIRKGCLERITQLEKARDALRSTSGALSAREQEVQKSLVSLRGNMQVVESQLAAAREVEKASSVLGADGSLDGVLSELEARITILGAEVESKLGLANAAQQAAIGGMAASSEAEKLLASSGPMTPANLLDQIQQISRAKVAGR